MNGKIRSSLFSTLITLFAITIVASQSKSTIKGVVYDTNSLPIASAQVILTDDNHTDFFKYKFTNVRGNFEFHVEYHAKFKLRFSHIGFADYTREFYHSDSITNLLVVLQPKIINLEEVVLEANRPIKIKKDTIVFKASSFVKGNEQVLEDLLRNIPGFNIGADGSIKIGKQEIEKVMVEGDDFFDKGYRVLTKNMPVHPVDEIELLKNYSNNALLKDIENSEKLALNIKLTENAKRFWFGNLSLGYGLAVSNRYVAKSNLMNFGSKNKYYFLSNLNNIGYDPTGDLQNLIMPSRGNEPGRIGSNVSTFNLLQGFRGPSDVSRNRTNFNNAELISGNTILNPSQKVKIKVQGLFNWDENDYTRNTLEEYSGNLTDFINNESFKSRGKVQNIFGGIDLDYAISDSESLDAEFKYSMGSLSTVINRQFNTNPLSEHLLTKNKLISYENIYTKKFKEKTALLISGRYLYQKSPQKYNLDSFIFEELFPINGSVDNVFQDAVNKVHFFGFAGHLLNENESENLLEVQLGGQSRIDYFQTSFGLTEQGVIRLLPEQFQNMLEYRSSQLYFKSKYLLKLNEVKVVGRLDFAQLFNQSSIEGHKESEAPFFISPTIGFEWKINSSNKISSFYSYNFKNSEISDIYPNYGLTNSRIFSKGTNKFNQLQFSNISVDYSLGNWQDLFFADVGLRLINNHTFFSTNSVISQNYLLIEKIKIKNSKLLFLTSNINRYFRDLSSTLKLIFNYSKSNYQNFVNDSNIRQVVSNNFVYGIELKSGFIGIFNYHLGSEWTNGSFVSGLKNTSIRNKSFLDLSLNLNKKLNFSAQSERFYIGNLDTQNDTYYFVDFSVGYKTRSDDISFSLTSKNLLNTSRVTNLSISDVGTIQTEYRLLPRFIILNFEYRF